MKHLHILSVLIFSVLLANSAWAQHGAADAHGLALDGYCPVAYVEMDKAMKGDKAIVATYMGQKYLFANRDAKKMFDKNPAKYAPKYDGTCATAVSMGKRMGADPQYFTTYKGALYMFSNKKTKQMFDKNPLAIIEKADKQWASMEK